MKISKKGIIICLVIVITAIICFLIVLFTGQKKNEIKLGMTREEAISILEQGHYQYEIKTPDSEPILWIDEVMFLGIKGTLTIRINLDNEVYSISFGTDVEDLDNKIAIINKYLYKSYGDPVGDDEIVLYPIEDSENFLFKKNDMAIVLTYPTSESHYKKQACIVWHKINSN